MYLSKQRNPLSGGFIPADGLLWKVNIMTRDQCTIDFPSDLKHSPTVTSNNVLILLRKILEQYSQVIYNTAIPSSPQSSNTFGSTKNSSRTPWFCGVMGEKNSTCTLSDLREEILRMNTFNLMQLVEFVSWISWHPI